MLPILPNIYTITKTLYKLNFVLVLSFKKIPQKLYGKKYKKKKKTQKNTFKNCLCARFASSNNFTFWTDQINYKQLQPTFRTWMNGITNTWIYRVAQVNNSTHRQAYWKRKNFMNEKKKNNDTHSLWAGSLLLLLLFFFLLQDLEDFLVARRGMDWLFDGGWKVMCK